MDTFSGVKVFSATLGEKRNRLGDQINGWLSANGHVEVIDYVVRQSSDRGFHCLSITIFFASRGAD
jgi:hypothetical protein